MARAKYQVLVIPYTIENKWVTYEMAKESLKFDSNVVALWELDNKI